MCAMIRFEVLCFELSHPDPAVVEHNIVVRSRFVELIGRMSSAHREGEDKVQGKQWLRSCRKSNFVCEALERSWGEDECCMSESRLANLRLL